MIKEKISKQELRAWAQEHKIIFALSIPVRHLQSLVNPQDQAWLWLYHYGDMNIEELLLREKDTQNKPNGTYVPTAYKNAAILFLERQLQDLQVARVEEKILETRIYDKKSVSKFLRPCLENLLLNRQRLREYIQPRSKSERSSGRIFFDSKRNELVYKEEKQNWCGDGRWPELRVSLHSGEVSCKCKKGAFARCRLAVSALDASLEWLCDDRIDHSIVKEHLSMPEWAKFLKDLDSLLLKRKSLVERLDNKDLGWRISTTSPHKLTPVAVEQLSENRYKQTAIAVSALRKHPSLCSSLRDRDILQTLLPAPTDKTKTRGILHEFLVQQAILMLCEHKYVFWGGKSSNPVSVKKLAIKLTLHKENRDGSPMYKLGFLWNNILLDSKVLAQRLRQYLSGELLLFPEDNNIYVSKISIEKQYLIDKITSKDISFSPKALPSLFKRLSKINQIFTLEIPSKYTHYISPSATICAHINADGTLHVEGQVFIEDISHPVGQCNGSGSVQ